nr:general transcription factor 3C polypeptide 5-like isoform X2 [Hydra vulgaris]
MQYTKMESNNECNNDDVPINFSNISTKKLVLVEYPGYIKSVDKMLTTLGGENLISEVFYKKKCRLQMTYRPEDLNAHFICADLVPCCGVLIKVRRRLKKDGNGMEYNQEICGIVKQSYKFQTLMDYQYLTQKSMWDYFKTIHGSELNLKNFPPHLTPPIFGRIDTCGSYNYRPDPVVAPTFSNKELASENVAAKHSTGFVRKKRYTESQAALFDAESVITHPSAKAIENLNVLKNGPDAEAARIIEELFAQRPLWSKAALKCHVQTGNERVKKILSCFSYYWLNGPWRTLWCRMGYDPRKDPKAKIYQLLEVRIRNSKDSNSNFAQLVPRRSNMNYTPRNLQTRVSMHSSSVINPIESNCDNTYQDLFPYIFSTTKPIYTRYMMYQLCDLHEPRAQELIHSNDGKETVCTEKDGWFEPGVLNKIRSLIVEAAYDYFKRQEVANPNTNLIKDEETDECSFVGDKSYNRMNKDNIDNVSFLQILNDVGVDND